MSHRMEIPEGCDGFDRVATIRNPFSRMVSCWNWMRKMENPAAHSPLERFLIHHKGEDPRDFWAFVREVEQNPHWLPSQSAQFRKIWPTHTVRYERPLEDYQALPWTPSQTRLHTTPQDPRTASWRAQYDEPTRKLVVKLWGDDFGSLGYSVDL